MARSGPEKPEHMRKTLTCTALATCLLLAGCYTTGIGKRPVGQQASTDPEPVRADSLRVSAPMPKYVPYKDPDTALVLSILLAGGGHIYAGESGKGAALLLAGPVALALGLAGTLEKSSIDPIVQRGACYYYGSNMGQNSYCEPDLVTGYETHVDMTPTYIAYGVAVGAWIYGMVDGPKAAMRANDRNGFAAEVSPTVMSSGGQPRPALSLRLNW